jgi:hypothetical protein
LLVVNASEVSGDAIGVLTPATTRRADVYCSAFGSATTLK